MSTKLKSSKGGILLYVVIISAIVSMMVFMISVLFGSATRSSKDIKNFITKDYKSDNIITNTESRYKNDPSDVNIFLKQSNFLHQATQYKNDYTVFLNSQKVSEKSWTLPFKKAQRERPFVSSSAGVLYDNKLDTLRSFKIYWNMKNTADTDELKKYNPMKRIEASNLRITLTKTGPQNSTRCFNTNNADVISDIGIDGGDSLASLFLNEITIKESYFKSATLSADCSKTPDYVGDPLANPAIAPDPFEPPLLNNDGILPLDFENYTFALKVEALDSAGHVRVQALGNNGFIPTNELEILVEPEREGELKLKKVSL
ncbi:hypothetical protein HON22_01845 [Candidatus Peregrinibacteria bacterium]|jgi:hypothetical protein|nr:hypothetical protein [Candidatus Peregrinibacteria bacterium]